MLGGGVRVLESILRSSSILILAKIELNLVFCLKQEVNWTSLDYLATVAKA